MGGVPCGLYRPACGRLAPLATPHVRHPERMVPSQWLDFDPERQSQAEPEMWRGAHDASWIAPCAFDRCGGHEQAGFPLFWPRVRHGPLRSATKRLALSADDGFEAVDGPLEGHGLDLYSNILHGVISTVRSAIAGEHGSFQGEPQEPTLYAVAGLAHPCVLLKELDRLRAEGRLFHGYLVARG